MHDTMAFVYFESVKTAVDAFYQITPVIVIKEEIGIC